MEISPLWVYLVFQMDNIAITIGLIWFVVLGLTITSIFSEMLEQSFKMLLLILLAITPLAALVPSSKTLAAAIIIPAVAENETLSQEARELYELAKQGFQELVEGRKEQE